MNGSVPCRPARSGWADTPETTRPGSLAGAGLHGFADRLGQVKGIEARRPQQKAFVTAGNGHKDRRVALAGGLVVVAPRT